MERKTITCDYRGCRARFTFTSATPPALLDWCKFQSSYNDGKDSKDTYHLCPKHAEEIHLLLNVKWEPRPCDEHLDKE